MQCFYENEFVKYIDNKMKTFCQIFFLQGMQDELAASLETEFNANLQQSLAKIGLAIRINADSIP